MMETKKQYQTGGIIKNGPFANGLVMPGETLLPCGVPAQYQAWKEHYEQLIHSLIKEGRKNGRYHFMGVYEIIFYILYNRYPNPRLLHLAKYAKKKRVRKKNYSRLGRGD